MEMRALWSKTSFSEFFVFSVFLSFPADSFLDIFSCPFLILSGKIGIVVFLKFFEIYNNTSEIHI